MFVLHRVAAVLGLAACLAPGLHAQQFTDVTGTSGMSGQKGYSAAPADFDGDGDLDIVIGSTSNNTLRVYRNNGTGQIQFTDSTSASGVPTNMTSARTITWADYDNDSDLDLFFGREVGQTASNNNLFRSNGNGTFTNVTSTVGLAATNTDPRGSAWADIDHDGDLDLYLAHARNFSGTQDRLWRNDGAMFTDVTVAANLPIANDPSFGIAFTDYDNDGDDDLYVETGAIGTGGAIPWPNKLLRNDWVQTGALHFTDVAPTLGMDPKGEGYATFWFDFDNDHDFDLYHALFTNGADVFNETNKLFRNEGDGTFNDIAGTAGVKHPFEDNGCQPFDYDYDGWEDFFVTSFVTNANDLFRNNADGTFSEPANNGIQGDNGGGNICPGDYDGDGDLDLIYISFSSNNVFRNNGAGLGHHLHVRLVGTQSNLDGVGAVVRVVTADGMSRRKTRQTGSGYGSALPQTLSFGLGTNTVAETVEVLWPKSRIVQVLTNVAADQTITVVEAGTPTAILSFASTRSVGDPLALSLRGTPGASVSLLLGALGDGPFAVPPYGTLLTDTAFLILVNGFGGLGPAIPANGVLTFNLAIPNDPGLVGLKVHLQGAQTLGGQTRLGNGVPLEFLP